MFSLPLIVYGLKRKVFCIFILLFFFNFVSSDAVEWHEISDKHFVIYYRDKDQESWIREVLRSAERYYTSIANDIGYARYTHFWTWDDRAKIYIYPNQDAFVSETGLPQWSSGGALRDKKLVDSKFIVSYMQENGFIDGVLPHEISHLLLRDFIGFDQDIPLWFDEGVAQLQEKNVLLKAEYVMRQFVQQGAHVPFELLIKHDIRGEDDPKNVLLFYGQSVSIIHFMIKNYGSDRFGRLCGLMKDGRDFKSALQGAYTNIIKDVNDLEKKWLSYMKNK